MNASASAVWPGSKILAGPAALVLSMSQPWGGEWRPVLGTAAWMLLWWITEAVPLAVPALLPLVLFPLLGVMPFKEAAMPYADPVIFLFMGGLFLALALEKHRVHLRLSLSIVRLTGTRADHIILGFMLAAFVLSMWISNTATTVMMLPIALSVIRLLEEKIQADPRQFRFFALSLMLGIAYAASIGGISTLIGTPPNAVFAAYFSKTYQYQVGFGPWMLVCLPLAVSLLAACYVLLVYVVYPSRLGEIRGAADLWQQQWQQLGRMQPAEKVLLGLFGATALLWISSSVISEWLNLKNLDSLIAVLMMIALFTVPVKGGDAPVLLRWKDTERIEWGILLLFGGGLCLAAGMEKAGIIAALGQAVQQSGIQEVWAITAILTTLALFLTEVMSNVALAAVMVPVVSGIAVSMGVHPLVMAVPVTLASSYAFMFPISTPPNAIVFASGYLRVQDMARVGFWLNLIAIALTLFFVYWLLPVAFDLSKGSAGFEVR